MVILRKQYSVSGAVGRKALKATAGTVANPNPDYTIAPVKKSGTNPGMI